MVDGPSFKLLSAYYSRELIRFLVMFVIKKLYYDIYLFFKLIDFIQFVVFVTSTLFFVAFSDLKNWLESFVSRDLWLLLAEYSELMLRLGKLIWVGDGEAVYFLWVEVCYLGIGRLRFFWICWIILFLFSYYFMSLYIININIILTTFQLLFIPHPINISK